jgi:AcrR family transcriptional regulator
MIAGAILRQMARPRKRRSAEDARAEILTVAEQRLIESGPASLRLQDLAAEVGVSHPAILHHFKSREGLVRAVVERAIGKLQGDLMEAISGSGQWTGRPLLDRVYETLATRGHARLMAWLLLEGYDPLDGPDIRTQWKQIIDATHAARVAASKDAGIAREDTAFAVMLSALAVFGQALAGPATFHAAGLGRSVRAQTQWRAWLADLLAAHLTRR